MVTYWPHDLYWVAPETDAPRGAVRPAAWTARSAVYLWGCAPQSCLRRYSQMPAPGLTVEQNGLPGCLLLKALSQGGSSRLSNCLQ